MTENYTDESLDVVSVNDSLITLPPNESSAPIPTAIAILIGVILSLIVTAILIAVIMFVKKRRSSEVSNSESKSHSTLSDLPSSGLKSIVIENNSLKQVKSSFFKWKSQESDQIKGNENVNKDQTKSDENKSKIKTKLKDEKKNELKKEIKDENSKTMRLD